MDCPTCRRPTTYRASAGARSLPKNYELLRVRQEIESYTQAQMQRLKQAWSAQVLEKEQLAKEAEEHARVAQRESVQASQRAVFLARQVEMNEQEKKRAQELAEEARHRALVASQQAEALQAETERLKQRLQHEAQQLARVQSDATSAAQVAQELHNKAESLQRQVDCVRAQLSLHAGRHDPTKLVVLVGEPTTVGSWLLPYTRYAVLSVATDSVTSGESDASVMDPYRVAKTWTMMRQVGEPTACVKVYRRYSDFLWLHHELQREFPFELVPCVPGKQLFFNKDKEFVGERMRLLQAFLRDVLRVPALATTEQVRAFLLATTEELEQLRQASRLFHQNDKFSVSDDDVGDVFSDDLDGPPETANGNGSMTNGANGSSASSNAWSAWGAVSAITSSAAKLVTTTGSALTGLSNGMTATSGGANGSNSNGANGTAGFPDDMQRELSSSLLADEHGHLSPLAEKRRKYVELSRAYETAAQKGSQLSRAERQQSHHLHRLCELMHEMNALDQSFARKRGRASVRESMSTTWRDGDIDNDDALSLRFESRPFDERASEAFSSISLVTKNNADCMEYALLEVVRMQMLELGGIEDAFARVRVREEGLHTANGGSNGVSTTSLGSPASSDSGNGSVTSLGVSTKCEELAQHRRELEEKVEALEPARTQFVFDTLHKNTLEMLKLAKTKRKLFEASRKQLRAGPSVGGAL